MALVNLRAKTAEGNFPDFDTYIGRTCGAFEATKWSPPFSVFGKTQEEILDGFEKHFWTHPELYNNVRKELKDKVLACWCGKLCHGSLLLLYASIESEEEWESIVKAQTAKFSSVLKEEQAARKAAMEKFRKSFAVTEEVPRSFYEKQVAMLSDADVLIKTKCVQPPTPSITTIPESPTLVLPSPPLSPPLSPSLLASSNTPEGKIKKVAVVAPMVAASPVCEPRDGQEKEEEECPPAPESQRFKRRVSKENAEKFEGLKKSLPFTRSKKAAKGVVYVPDSEEENDDDEEEEAQELPLSQPRFWKRAHVLDIDEDTVDAAPPQTKKLRKL